MKKKPKEKLELNKLSLKEKQLLPLKPEGEVEFEPIQELVQEGWFKYLIETEKREEIIGDLMETRHEMEKEGHSKWVIALVMLARKSLILIYLLRGRIGDYGEKKREVDRNK